MDNQMKISASVVSHLGMVKKENKDNFYINGRYIFEHDTDNVQVSIETNASSFLFAVCDNMERQTDERSMPISLTKELRIFHEREKASQKDIYYQFDKLYESMDETSNLIHSLDIVNGRQDAGKSGAAVLYISDNKAAVIDSGGCRAYLLRDGKLKSLTVDYKKTERLLRMGIITHEQAQVLASRLGSSTDNRQVESRKTDVFELREGDLFLLCTNGLTDYVDEDRIYELLDSDETDMISNLLLKEALKTGGEDNITVMTVKVDSLRKKIKEQDAGYLKGKTINITQVINARSQIFQKLLTVVTSIIIIAGLLFGAYKLWGLIADSKGSDTTTYNPVTRDNNTTVENEVTDQDDEEDNLTENGEESGTEGGQVADGTGSGSTGSDNQWPVEYKVKRGDNLYSISNRFYNDPNKYTLIMEANGLSNPNLIYEGQVLVIPKP
ncbi:MAG TPA: LysM peptidoglycan-binding domain-containing protein [Clostridiaceae bacterium]|nr:LysM peptidoglycan-binding domain-containing protein [Clostridiaceae bacterium]